MTRDFDSGVSGSQQSFLSNPHPGLQPRAPPPPSGQELRGVSSFSKRAFLSMTRSRRPILLFVFAVLSAAPSFVLWCCYRLPCLRFMVL